MTDEQERYERIDLPFYTERIAPLLPGDLYQPAGRARY